MYIGARFGPGPRDGLMTGLARRTGRSLRLVRVCIELTVLAIGLAARRNGRRRHRAVRRQHRPARAVLPAAARHRRHEGSIPASMPIPAGSRSGARAGSYAAEIVVLMAHDQMPELTSR